jgi:hypothetical protein
LAVCGVVTWKLMSSLRSMLQRMWHAHMASASGATSMSTLRGEQAQRRHSVGRW